MASLCIKMYSKQFCNGVPQQTKSHTAELRAKPEYHKFLIGKGGGNIRKVRDSTGARIIFPTAEDKDQELITVIGTEEAVQDAQRELEELIKSLVRPTRTFRRMRQVRISSL